MQRAMQIEVYPTDAEAFEAAAALVAERLRAVVSDRRPTIALGGGRSARGVLVALAARGDVPWERVEWCLADERCTEPGDPLRHGKVARDSLFTPRGIAAARIHEPPLSAGAPEVVAARYAEALAGLAGNPIALDVVVVALGADGALGSIRDPGADGATVVVPGDPVQVGIGPRLIAQARSVVVTAVGSPTAGALAGALRDGAGAATLALPSERVAWFVDRDAAGELLKTARPVAEPPG
jgi:6-phosphogluconolactonase/glucosamine-6-phosphate isomerase/deaminase